jgi:hypothetical protein
VKEDVEPEVPFVLARAYCTNCPPDVYDKDPVMCVSLENDEHYGMAMYCHECISNAYAAFLVAEAEKETP